MHQLANSLDKNSQQKGQYDNFVLQIKKIRSNSLVARTRPLQFGRDCFRDPTNQELVFEMERWRRSRPAQPETRGMRVLQAAAIICLLFVAQR